MAENINAALRTLKHALAMNDTVPIVIPEAALDQQFQGLNLHQLTQLTEAPALAVVSTARAGDGAQIERFSVDGNDEQRRSLVAQQLLLDGDPSPNPGDVREVHLRTDGGTGEILVRDHNNIVYRVTDREAVIDEELTELLRQRHISDRRPDVPPQSLEIENDRAFHGTMTEILHGLAALRVRNSVALQELRRLIEETGERDLESALEVVDPKILVKVFERILLASNQIERLADGIALRTQALQRAAGSPQSVVESVAEPAAPEAAESQEQGEAGSPPRKLS